MEYQCPICGKEFTAYASAKRIYCSLSCATKKKWKDLGYQKQVSKRMSRTMKERWQDPEARKRASEKAKKQFKSPEARKQLSERAKKQFESPEARKRESERMKTYWANPNHTRTGGGGIITEPQKILVQELGGGWETEVAIGLGKRVPGQATNYQVDIGNGLLKLAIEVDGLGHKERKQKALDRKKEAKLKELGWRVIRFWNHEILEDLSGVMKTIKEELST